MYVLPVEAEAMMGLERRLWRMLEQHAYLRMGQGHHVPLQLLRTDTGTRRYVNTQPTANTHFDVKMVGDIKGTSDQRGRCMSEK